MTFTPPGFSTGVPTSDTPLSLVPKSYTGVVAFGTEDILYNRITLSPTQSILGNVTSEVIINYQVTNLYSVTKTIIQLLVSDPEGIETTAVFPLDVLPFQTVVVPVRITLDGPPIIDTSVLFDFADSEDDRTATIIGSRIVTLPYIFSRGMTETLEWKTDTITTQNGKVQTIRNRKSPRQNFSVRMPLPIGEMTRSENLLYGRRKFPWALPVWSEGRFADSSIALGSNLINVDTNYGDFRVGGLVSIIQSEDVFETFEIESLTASSITIDGVTENAYIVPPVITPTRLAVMTSDPIRNTNGYNGFIQASFRVTDNIHIPAGTPTYTYLGYDVFVEEPLIQQNFIQDRYVSRVDVIDYESGVTTTFAPWLYTRINRSFMLRGDNLEDIWEIRRWLHRRNGKNTPFWMPTFESNLFVLNATPILNVLNVRQVLYGTQASNRDHLAIRLKNGNWLFREVILIEQDLFGNEDVTLDTDLNILTSDIDFVSFMGLKILASDRIEIRWSSNNVAEAIIPIEEIEP